MEINIHTNISKDFKNIDIIINSPNFNEQINQIINYINTISEFNKNEILGQKDNEFFLLPYKDIIYFYSETKNNYCKTSKGTFKIFQKLYELEDKLPPDIFLRISNSVIINIKHVVSFNTGTIGTIIVKFDDNSFEYVSKRKISKILKFLKERRK